MIDCQMHYSVRQISVFYWAPCIYYICMSATEVPPKLGLGDITIYASRLLHRSALRYIAYCMTLDNHNL